MLKSSWSRLTSAVFKALLPKSSRRRTGRVYSEPLESRVLLTAEALDETFDGDGIVNTPIGASDDLGRSVAIQSDGKIVVTGESYNGSNYNFAVARYHTNGTLDTSFGNNGKAVLDFASTTDYPSRVAIQNFEVNGVMEERIILAGYKLAGDNCDFAIARFLPNGQLDTSFGNQGKQVTPVVSSDDAIHALAIQPDGKILAGGFSTSGTDNDYALARYDINGTLDPTFQNNSSPVLEIVITNLGLGGAIQSNDQASDIVLQGDKIILAGFSIVGSTNDFSAVRYLNTGAIDTTFGGSGTGILSTPFSVGSADSATTIAIGPDSKLVFGGYTQTGTRSVFALTRYSADGVLDITFGTGGKVTTAISDFDDRISDLEIQPDGRIIAVGATRPASTGRYSMQMVRYNVDGLLDSSFDGDGKRTFTLGANHSILTRLAIQPDGRLLVAGYSHNGADYDFTVIRCLADSDENKNTADTDDLLQDTSTVSAIGMEDRRPAPHDAAITKVLPQVADRHPLQSSGTLILTSLYSAEDPATSGSESGVPSPLEGSSLVEIREPARIRDEHSLSVHQGGVTSICFVSVGDELLSVGEDGSLKRSIISSNTSVLQVGEFVRSCDFLNERQLLIEEMGPHAAKLIEIDSLSKINPGTRASRTIPSAWWPKISQATQTVFSFSAALPEETPAVMKWSADLKQSTRLGPPRSVVLTRYNRYAVSADESFLALVAEKLDGQQQVSGFEFLLWDLRRNRATARHACEYPYGLSFSPNSESVAIMAGGFLTLLNTTTGEENYKVPCPDFQDFAFSPDNTEVAIVSEDRTLRRLRMKDGSEIARVDADEVAARGVAYAPDGLTLGTVGGDGYLRCWRVDVMEATMELPLGTPLMQIRFSPNGRALAMLDNTGRCFLLTSE